MANSIMKTLRINDIKTSEILYYDRALESACLKFCTLRNIDCLPDLDDSGFIHIRDKDSGKFHREKYGEERSIQGQTNIFDKGMLDKFRASPLLMVYDADELTGVVHFSDYDKPEVSIFLYELFHAYEKSLRSLLRNAGKKDADMLGYFEHKKEKDKAFYADKPAEYEKHSKKQKRSDFEYFQIRDLISLVVHNGLAKLKCDSELRNMVMHSHGLISKEDPASDGYIYDMASFEKFFKSALCVLSDLRRVKNHLSLMPPRGFDG